jgi:hypothetical protein
MLHSFMMFLAPADAQVQATPTSPPAVARPARRPARGSISLRMAANVLGNAVGFIALLAGCWLVLQLIGAFL